MRGGGRIHSGRADVYLRPMSHINNGRGAGLSAPSFGVPSGWKRQHHVSDNAAVNDRKRGTEGGRVGAETFPLRSNPKRLSRAAL